MDKRWLLPIALAVAVGVAIGVVAAVGPSGVTVAGVASAAPIPAAPVVGDCLTGGPDGPFPVDPTIGEPVNAPYARSLGPCDGVRYGEVTAVIDGQARNIDADGYLTGRLPMDCDSALEQYVGAPAVVDATEHWWPSFTDGSFAVGPAPRQARSDQDWAACLMRPPLFGPGGTVGQVGEDGTTTVGADSLRGRWSDVETRNRLGSCWTADPDAGDVPTYCGDPHHWETLAWTSWVDGDDVDDLAASCGRALAAIVGVDDPTVGGVLTIRVDTLDADGNAVPLTATSDVVEGQNIECTLRTVDDTRSLTATLAGLGDGAPPLAPR